MAINKKSPALAAKYKELAVTIQVFLESQPDDVCESPDCEALTLA